MMRVIAISPFDAGGGVVQPGKAVELDDEVALSLVNDGVAVPDEPPIHPQLMAALADIDAGHLTAFAALDPELRRVAVDPLGPAVAAAHLTADQLTRLRELSAKEVGALLFPSAPTVKAALAAAVEAFPNASAKESAAFAKALGFAAKEEDAIAGACRALKIGRDSASWTDDGLPTVKAVEAATGFDLTAAKRDAGWAAVEG